MTLSRSTESGCLVREVEQAALHLEAGGLLAYPTETSWGLAARIDSPRAVASLRAFKGRDADKPLSLLVSGEAALAARGAFVDDAARALVRAFWPGPLTLVLPDRHARGAGVVAGQGAGAGAVAGRGADAGVVASRGAGAARDENVAPAANANTNANAARAVNANTNANAAPAVNANTNANAARAVNANTNANATPAVNANTNANAAPAVNANTNANAAGRGFRCSPHPAAQALALWSERRGIGPFTATSLNLSGRPACSDFAAARRLVEHAAPAPGSSGFELRILDIALYGDAGGMPASSVVDVQKHPPRMLRVGAVSEERISAVLADAGAGSTAG